MTALYDRALQPLDIGLQPHVGGLAPLRQRVLPSLVRRLRRRRLDLLLVAVLCLVAGWVHAVGMYDSPARFDDEGTYTAYAWAVQNWGELSHYTYWYAHPPIGWMQMSAWTWLTGAFDHAPYAVAAVRELMLVLKIVDVVLIYALTRRLRLGRFAAVLSVLIFALSPLAVYFTRTALLDNIVTPWLLGAFLLAASPRRSVAAAAGSATCMAVAVLSKETALLYLPAVLVLFFQTADRRNRRFTLSVFLTLFVLLCAAYPTYALIKDELLQGPGHVSLEWAVRWQLFERTGSGNIFNPNSTAHAVIRSWIQLDPWLPKLSLLLVLPALVMRRTRAVALAFALQVVQLLRNGYLPYPYVIAMLPFAAIVVGGVLGRASGALWIPGQPVVRKLTALARRTVGLPYDITAIDPTFVSLLRLGSSRDPRPEPTFVSLVRGGTSGDPMPDSDWLAVNRGARGRRPLQVIRRLRRGVVSVSGAPRWLLHTVGLVATVGLVVVVGQAWRVPLNDLRSVSRDQGKAQALEWVLHNVPTSARLVVDDSMWVDLVRAGYSPERVIWFTKLDVDPDVKLPGSPQWKAIDYVVVDHQDDLSLHVQGDGLPSPDTLSMFPTMGRALQHVGSTRTFGIGLDAITVRQVDPNRPAPHSGAGSAADASAATGSATTGSAAKSPAAKGPAAKGPVATGSAAKSSATKARRGHASKRARPPGPASRGPL